MEILETAKLGTETRHDTAGMFAELSWATRAKMIGAGVTQGKNIGIAFQFS